MAIPTSRTEFAQYCLRRLGSPVIQINVSDEQIDDRIDEALIFFRDYHFEGSEKFFFKFPVTQNNFPTSIYGTTINLGGIGYSNTDVLQFVGGGGNAANGTITTDANGTIIQTNFANNGTGYALAPTVNIITAGGQGANITAELGGFIPVPPAIIGIVDIFDVGLAESSVNNIFNIRYQIALNDLYMLNNLWMPDYYLVRQNISLIQEVLIGKQPIRFNRYKNRLYIDMDWMNTAVGNYLILETYSVLDPNVYTQIWSDRWLQRYTCSLIKEQWGSNIQKYGGMALVGGMTFNGAQIMEQALAEKAALEQEMFDSWSLPPALMMG